MSCSGCRVLRKRCSDGCSLRSCLQWIEGADAQAHATAFVAKFFGRQGLSNFINAVPENHRAALFRSLLYEACGRTVNPVHGAVGLLWSGNWQFCQDAVATVLKGGNLHSLAVSSPAALDNASFIHFPGMELHDRDLKPEPTTLLLQRQTGSIAAQMDQNIPETNVEQESSFTPSMLFSSSNCGRELSCIGLPSISKKKPREDDICNVLKPVKPENHGNLHHLAKKLPLKRKYEEATSQAEQAAPGQGASAGLETLLEAIHRRDAMTGTPPTSDIDLDLTLGSYRPSTPAYDPSQRPHKDAGTIMNSGTLEDHSVSSEGSVTSLHTAGLSVSCVAALDRQHEITLSKHTSQSKFIP